MYQRSISNDWLYTGDIIKGLKLPNLKNEDFQLVSNSNHEERFTVRKYHKSGYYVYMSHECDFNAGKRTYFILSPLINIGKQIRNDNIEMPKFIKSNDVKQFPHYLNYFYFEQGDFLESDMCVDFTHMISFPSSQKELLLDNKCAQLKEDFRARLKYKIGYYFSHSEE